MIQKLSTRPPSQEVRRRATQEIAAERGIDLEFDEAASDPPAEAFQEEGAMKKQPAAPMHVMREEANNSGELLSVKYEDVATAAKDAYEAAAFAAAAARVAAKLCRSQSEANA